MAGKYYWLKKRFNPQFKGPYYVEMGQITTAEAKRNERSIYGDNVMLKFLTEDAYNAEIAKLKASGKRVIK